MDWKDKVVIITGAGSGIGRALANRLARDGANLILADRDAGAVEKTAAVLTGMNLKAKAATLDVTDRAAVKELVDATVAEHGMLDCIFNNAGIGVGGEARDFAYEDWKTVIDVDLYGVVNGVFAAYPIMVRQGFGRIVNTASVAGLLPFPGELSYTAAKFGVVGLSLGLRAEAADLGVKVSVVCPGVIDTPIFETTKIVGFDRKKVLGMFPKGLAPEKCAEIIIKGVERNKATIVVTWTAWALWLLYRLSPALSVRLLALYMRRMRTARNNAETPTSPPLP